MNLIRDFGYGLRQMARRPVFSALIVLTLAIGIGPNVAIFSVLKALVIDPLPYPEAHRLVQVWETDKSHRGEQPWSYPDFLDAREQSTSFEAFGVQWPRGYNLGGDEPERVDGVMVTADALTLWGVPPAHGRLFTEEETDAEARLAVLSDALWKRRFGGDPQVVGESVTIDGVAHEIVGIMPPDFEYFTAWTGQRPVDLWTPLVEPEWSNRGGHWLLAVARLKEDVPWGSAEAELRAIAARLQEEYPTSNARTTMWVKPFLIQVVQGVGAQLFILIVAVGFVLLTACANVAGMLLARGADRKTEIAIRGAMGAGKSRILLQLMTESSLLSLLGGAAGVLLGYWCVNLIKSIAPAHVPRTHGIEIDSAAMIFALVLTVGTGLLFSLVPALTLAQTDTASILREGSGTVTATRRRHRRLRWLAVAQIAVAFVLTNGAILLFTSYRNVLHEDYSFDTDNVVTARVGLRGERYDSGEKRVLFWRDLIDRLEDRPGIEAAGLVSKLPMSGGTNTTVLVKDEIYDPQVRRSLVETSRISPGYFAAMGIPLLAGRVVEWDEGAYEDRPVVVNKALVDRYFPDEDPLGRQIRHNVAAGGWTATIVGVVENVPQWGPTHYALPEIYISYGTEPLVDTHLVLRAPHDSSALVSIALGVLAGIDSDLPLGDPMTMGELLAEKTSGRFFLLQLISLFAGLAMLLAMGGIFGTISHNVAQRSREIGVRVAFGAHRGRILAMVLREGLLLDVTGIGAGLGFLMLFTIILKSQLYGVGALGVAYLVMSALLLAAVTLVAAILPAMRAARVDPMQALRTE